MAILVNIRWFRSTDGSSGLQTAVLVHRRRFWSKGGGSGPQTMVQIHRRWFWSTGDGSGPQTAVLVWSTDDSSGLQTDVLVHRRRFWSTDDSSGQQIAAPNGARVSCCCERDILGAFGALRPSVGVYFRNRRGLEPATREEGRNIGRWRGRGQIQQEERCFTCVTCFTGFTGFTGFTAQGRVKQPEGDEEAQINADLNSQSSASASEHQQQLLPGERPHHSTTSKVAYFKRKYAEEEDLHGGLHGYFQKHLILQEDRSCILKLSLEKLRFLEDSEAYLRRSVLINNLLRKIHHEEEELETEEEEVERRYPDRKRVKVLVTDCCSPAFSLEEMQRYRLVPCYPPATCFYSISPNHQVLLLEDND
ncbi:uncharacterized protein LOC121630868 [Melanotaenia boesemani]|uniref:uncharacterized protein LOC121630868 n=1 Tax=Melanotaenia boesemani TaxID=1250792 RepID=UPI001C0563E1|nr:uncharacterized protein LOC121630868 [Melanotaenia boesemani]